MNFYVGQWEEQHTGVLVSNLGGVWGVIESKCMTFLVKASSTLSLTWHHFFSYSTLAPNLPHSSQLITDWILPHQQFNRRLSPEQFASFSTSLDLGSISVFFEQLPWPFSHQFMDGQLDLSSLVETRMWTNDIRGVRKAHAIVFLAWRSSLLV